jgi:hypothetical protein
MMKRCRYPAVVVNEKSDFQQEAGYHADEAFSGGLIKLQPICMNGK